MPFAIKTPSKIRTRINVFDALPDDRLLVEFENGQTLALRCVPPDPTLICDKGLSSPALIEEFCRENLTAILHSGRRRAHFRVTVSAELLQDAVKSVEISLLSRRIVIGRPLMVSVSNGLESWLDAANGSPVKSLAPSTL